MSESMHANQLRFERERERKEREDEGGETRGCTNPREEMGRKDKKTLPNPSLFQT